MRSRFIPIVAVAASLVFTNQLAVADQPTPAFASPDGRQVPAGHWQNFFTPAHLLPLSYLPIKNSDKENFFSSILPPCDGNQNACIQKVEYKLGGGEWNQASSGPDEGQRAVAYGTLNGPNNWTWVPSETFPENINDFRPQGSTARLWDFSNAPHVAGSMYQIGARFSGIQSKSGLYNPDSFYLQVLPVTRVPGDSITCKQPSIFEERYLQRQEGYCKTLYDFPTDLKVRITMKFGKFMPFIKGWFDGRLGDAVITVNSDSETVTFEGSPLVVPSASTRPIKYEEMVKNKIQPLSADVIATAGTFAGTAGMVTANIEAELQNFITQSPLIGERATGENTVWMISSIAESGNNQCIQPGALNGIVLTNATVYNASAPKWNERNSSLDFRVAATHFNSKGELFKGYYKLLVSEKVASCYWGPDFSKGTASISITNQDGTTGVATTNLGLRDGWVNFEAAGFTFSSPTISAIIKKAPVVAPTPTPTPSPTPTATQAPIAKKKTITCIAAKKKSVKVVGLNPKCPAGYKKK